MTADLFRFSSTTMRRLSCIPEALSLVPQRAELRRDMTFSEQERRASQDQQDMNKAVQFLQRRKSSDSNGIIGQLDSSLYRKRNSVVNVRGSKDSLCVGRTQVKIHYDFDRCDFVIILLEASFDIKLEECQLVFSLGENQRKVSRPILPGCTLNTQNFKFSIEFEELLNRTLTVELISPKQSGYGTQRHGISVMPIQSLAPTDQLLIWLELEAINNQEESCGDIQLFLSFLPQAERLTLTIQEAVKLQRIEPTMKDVGVFVKANLMIGEKVVKKRKSNVKKATDSNSVVVWNEALSFCDVDSKTLNRCKLEIFLVGCNQNGTQFTIGQLIFEQPAEGAALTKETKIWRDMLTGKSINLLHWLQLRE